MELSIKETPELGFLGVLEKELFHLCSACIYYYNSILLIGQISFGILDSYVNVSSIYCHLPCC